MCKCKREEDAPIWSLFLLKQSTMEEGGALQWWAHAKKPPLPPDSNWVAPFYLLIRLVLAAVASLTSDTLLSIRIGRRGSG